MGVLAKACRSPGGPASSHVTAYKAAAKPSSATSIPGSSLDPIASAPLAGRSCSTTGDGFGATARPNLRVHFGNVYFRQTLSPDTFFATKVYRHAIGLV